MRCSIVAPLLFALGETVAGCATEGWDRNPDVGTDSGSLADVGLAVSQSPSVTLRSALGEAATPYSHVVGATRLANGTYIVADAGTSELLAYDPAGAFLRRIARRGKGPGELERVTAVWRYEGDTLVAINASPLGASRIAVFAPEGHWVRTWSPATPPGETIGVRVRVVANDGHLFMTTGTPLRPAAAPVIDRELERGYWYDNGGRPGTLAGAFPGPLRYRSSGMKQALIPFSIGTQFATANNELYASDPDSAVVRRYRRDGTLIAVIPLGISADPVRPRDARLARRQAHEAARRRFAPLRNRRIPQPLQETIRDQIAAADEIPIPQMFPVLERILVDPRGYLWAARFRRPDRLDPNVWWVFDGAGKRVGALRLPDALTALEIGDDYLIGLRRDLGGGESVEVYELSRTTPPGRDR